MDLTLRLSPDRLLRWMLGLSLALTATSVAFAYVYLERGHDLRGLAPLFLLEEDTAVPTWFAAAQLASAALLMAALGLQARATDRVLARGWLLLAAVFTVLSIDEVATLHEWTGDVLGEGRGLLYYSWVVVGAAGLAVVGVLSVPLLRRLPRRTRRLVLVAAAVYVGGALLMEMVNGWLDEVGSSDMRYNLQSAVEETMEMVGASLFVHALADYARSVPLRVSLGFADAARQR